MNPFDYVKSISETKENLINDKQSEREYSPFLTNRSFSMHVDTVHHANEMNLHHHLDKKLQYDFLINTVRKRKRFGWFKKDKSAKVEMLMEYYNYSYAKASEAVKVLTEEQLKLIRKKLDKGGTK